MRSVTRRLRHCVPRLRQGGTVGVDEDRWGLDTVRVAMGTNLTKPGTARLGSSVRRAAEYYWGLVKGFTRLETFSFGGTSGDACDIHGGGAGTPSGSLWW